jgi:hypothetical protein
MNRSTLRLIALSAVLVLLTAGVAYGQAQAGNLYGKTLTPDGASLPGVTVTVSGQATQVQVTDANGDFRFLGLSPGNYQLTAELDGFSTVEYPNVQISVGRNTSLQVQMSEAVEETITVTSESPLLDSRKITTGSTVNALELEKIPTSRDPWAILQTVPGVQVDRINVGGNESGQQAQYVGPGSSGDDAVWAVDGVVITDMGAIGSSPTYYNFDAFQEMQAATGGSDATLATAGVTLNMVTKRGGNDWKGGGRFVTADDSWQSDLSLDSGELGQAFGGPGAAGVLPGQPHRLDRGLRLRDRRSDHPGQALDLGQLRRPGRRAPDHRRCLRHHLARQLRRQDQRPADGLQLAGGVLQLRRQGEDWP